MWFSLAKTASSVTVYCLGRSKERYTGSCWRVHRHYFYAQTIRMPWVCSVLSVAQYGPRDRCSTAERPTGKDRERQRMKTSRFKVYVRGWAL